MTETINPFDVAGKIVVVTGAGSGIGRSITVGFATRGARVFALDVNDEFLAETVAEAAAAGIELETLLVDVTKEEQVVAAFAQIVASAGAPDVVFANAGIAGDLVPVQDLELDQWKRTIAVNLDGTFLTAREAYRAMLPAGRGKLILTTSVWGIRGSTDGPFTAYAASKGGVWNLVHQMAINMAEHGVTVNGIAPAGVHTRVGDGFYDNAPDAVESLRQQIPSGKIVGPDVIIGPALFLASTSSDHVNGHVLAVDGGYLAR
jgi:gluconate 5-dehydrogenase